KGKDQVLDPWIIVEHKAKGDRWWNYNDSLPEEQHICQAWLYGYLWHQRWPAQEYPIVILYYRSWGHWAEYQITADDNGVRLRGAMDDKPVQDLVWLDPNDKRMQLEGYVIDCRVPDLGEIGLSSASDGQGCTFQGRPSCRFYEECWGR
ncbi:MAG TPA: hypothetical protein VM366_05875, partial [Anaerolineae bacterium]|nr:hypothetical protein [Anaerolineae bacterium]